MRGALVVRAERGIEPRQRVITGEHVVVGRTVIRIAMPERAHEREFVGLAGAHWQVPADANTGSVRVDRPERGPGFGRRLGPDGPGVARAPAPRADQSDIRYV